MPRWTAISGGHKVRKYHPCAHIVVVGNCFLLTVENTCQIDVQGLELGRNRLSIHHGQVTGADATFLLRYACIWNLRDVIDYPYRKRGNVAPRKGTDHDINSTIAPKCKLKKSDLVIPTDHIAFD